MIPRRTFIKRFAAASASSIAPGILAATPADDALRKHRITAMEFKRVAQPWPRLVGKNSRLDVHGRGPSPEICILKTDLGATGWGMIEGDSKQIRDNKSAILGKSIDSLFAPSIGIRDEAYRGIDIPLHDLAGVILDQPVWKMIGGGEKPVITKIYSGMIYFDDLEPAANPRGLDAVLENARWDHDHGYRQLKVKIGRGAKWMPAEVGLARDIEVVRAIAAALPGCGLLVDANNAYTVATAIRFLEGIAGIPLFWFEEPFHETPDDWRKLHSWMQTNGYANTYRADGEYAPDTKVLDQLGAEGVLNMRLEDIMGYGFTRWRQFLPRLAKQKIAASPHAWGAGLKSIYIGHLAAALGNIPTIEGVTCGEEDVELGENRIVDGNFHPSFAPGFGMKLRVN